MKLSALSNQLAAKACADDGPLRESLAESRELIAEG
jgi:hypothetical protein